MNKYVLKVFFETDEDFGSAAEVLDGSPLLDADFRGVITSAKLKVR